MAKKLAVFYISCKVLLLLASMAAVTGGVFVELRSSSLAVLLSTRPFARAVVAVSTGAAIYASLGILSLMKNLSYLAKLCFLKLLLVNVLTVGVLTMLICYGFRIEQRWHQSILDSLHLYRDDKDIRYYGIYFFFRVFNLIGHLLQHKTFFSFS